MDIDCKRLGLINYAFSPDFNTDNSEFSAVKNLVNEYRENGVEFKALADWEVIIVEV